jgi:hypothetical protein
MALPKHVGEEFEFPHEKEAKASKADAAEDAAFELEIEDDTPVTDRNRKAAPPPEDPTDEELSTYDEKVQSRIKKFTRGYHDERRAKETAERERTAAEDFAQKVYEENKKLKEQLKSGSEVFIEQNKSTAQKDLEDAKKRMKEAFEAGDSDGLATAQEEITKATMRMDRAQSMRPIEAPDNDPPPRTAVNKVAPKTQAWVSENSEWFGVDEEMTMSAMGLDKKLQKQYGADYIGTDDYFKTIDKVMRKRFPENFGSHEDDDDPSQNQSDPAEEETPPRRASKPATVVASAARSTPPSRIKLKASQVALARKLGITPEQYAKQVALLGRNE